jgi:hypothetical protein
MEQHNDTPMTDVDLLAENLKAERDWYDKQRKVGSPISWKPLRKELVYWVSKGIDVESRLRDAITVCTVLHTLECVAILVLFIFWLK